MCVNLVVLRKLWEKLRCFPEKFTQLAHILHDRRSWRSRQISTLRANFKDRAERENIEYDEIREGIIWNFEGWVSGGWQGLMLHRPLPRETLLHNLPLFFTTVLASSPSFCPLRPSSPCGALSLLAQPHPPPPFPLLSWISIYFCLCVCVSVFVFAYASFSLSELFRSFLPNPFTLGSTSSSSGFVLFCLPSPPLAFLLTLLS